MCLKTIASAELLILLDAGFEIRESCTFPEEPSMTTHGFQRQHLKESKAQRKQLFLGTLQKHFRDIHGWNI